MGIPADRNPLTRSKTPIPIHAFYGLSVSQLVPEYLAQLVQADIIFARDVTTQIEVLMYGRDVMDEVERTGIGRALKIMVVELDRETDELETLAALTEVVKGRHDYVST